MRDVVRGWSYDPLSILSLRFRCKYNLYDFCVYWFSFNSIV